MSDNHVIPDAAIDAARDALYENDRSIDIDYATLEAALEAAAPHMLASGLYVSIPCSRCGEAREQPVPR